MTKWYWGLCLAVIVILGAAVRLYKLGEVPVSLYWDEVAMLADAKAIAATGRDLHGNSWLQAIFPSYGDYKLPVYIWLASVSVRFFGISEWALRFPSALVGIGTMVLAGFIARELFYSFQKKEKDVLFLLAVAVTAFAPWSIFFSRTGFEAHVGQFFLAGSVWCALAMRHNWRWGVGAALLGAAATYSYFSVQFVWPGVFLATIFLFTWPKRHRLVKWVILSVLLPLVGYWLLLQPLLRSPLAEASRQFRLSTVSVVNMADWPVVANQYRLLAGNMWWDKALYHPVVLQGRELLKNYADFISFDFLFLTGDSNLRHGTGRHGLFLWVMAPFFLYGWYSLFPKYWKQAALLCIWWIAALLPAAVPETTPHALRSLNALMPLVLVMSWGSWQAWKAWQESSLHGIWKAGIALAVSGLCLISFAGWLQYYWQVYPFRSAQSWQAGYRELADAIWQLQETEENILLRPSDDRFYLWLLAYHVPAAELANIEYHNYQPHHIGRISVGWLSADALNSLNHGSVTLVAEKEFVDKQLETLSIAPTTYELLPSPFEQTFAAAHFERTQ